MGPGRPREAEGGGDVPADVAADDWAALGCLVRLAVTDPSVLVPARGQLSADLADLDRAASRFRADSELRRLDDRAGTDVGLSPLLAELLAVALDAARDTDGDLDPTVGAALAACGYDTDFAAVAPSGPGLHVVPAPVPGWQRVRLDRPARSVRTDPGVRLDLGATAKAWQADESASRLAETFGCGVLVALGGDLAVAGDPPHGGWQVRVQDVTGRPGEAATGPWSAVSLTEGGLATSSTAARSWTRGGRLLHHIVDPRDGLPVVTPWRTVSVAASSCTRANTVSTAAVIRGDGAPAWLAGLGLPARLVRTDGTVRLLNGWPTDSEHAAQPGPGARAEVS